MNVDVVVLVVVDDDDDDDVVVVVVVAADGAPSTGCVGTEFKGLVNMEDATLLSMRLACKHKGSMLLSSSLPFRTVGSVGNDEKESTLAAVVAALELPPAPTYLVPP